MDYGQGTTDSGQRTVDQKQGASFLVRCLLSVVRCPLSRLGFTLIEAILTMTLLTGGILGVLTLFQNNVSEANKMEHTLIATYLAQERLEQIILDKKYRLYAYVTGANYAASENMATQGFTGYTRTTNIVEVSASNLTTPQNGSGYKRVTVTVQPSGGETVTLTTLVTQWGEQ